MTNDYKEQLLKYMTGKLDNETGVNEPQPSLETKSGNFMQYLEEELAQIYEYAEPSITGCLSSEKYENNIIYGYYNNGDTGYVGFILVVNEKYEPIQLITTFDSETSFRFFEALNVDEDGNIWGVDSSGQGQAADPADFRFIMLNNIFNSGQKTGNYYVRLRASYYFPNDYQTSLAGYVMEAGRNQGDTLYKQIGNANYYMSIGNAIVSLEINVGESNNWTIVKNYSMIDQCTIYPVYDNDNFYLILSNKKLNSSNLYDYTEYLYTAGENPTITSKMSVPSFSDRNLQSWLKINNTTCYVAYVDNVDNDGETQNTYIYKINYDNNTLRLIYTIPGTYYIPGNKTYFSQKNNVPFIIYISNNPIAQYSYEWQRQFGIIFNDNIYLTQLTTVNSYMDVAENLYINNKYNLYKMYVFNNYTSSTGTHDEISLVFNQINYNGLPYKALNSLIPNSGILYDNDDDVIFARNLYNKTVSGATTTSTVQIPNTLLNDTTIAQSDLIGQTNMELVNDTTPITKNIYETVDINFSNTLVMRNDNDENNKILNPIGSSRLNNSVSQTIDYENAQATKLRVNYADDTNLIITLSSAQITILTDTKARYSFSIYVDKEINNIQIISFDENTVYQTINNLNLTIGKIYNIIQDVEIL